MAVYVNAGDAIGVKNDIFGNKAELEMKIDLMLVDTILECKKRQRLVVKWLELEL